MICCLAYGKRNALFGFADSLWNESVQFCHSIRFIIHFTSILQLRIPKIKRYNLHIPIYPAIIRIHEPQNISTHTQIARPSGKISLQACVIVLGSGDVATVLQHVSMPAISNSECSSRWFFIPGASINAGHICVYQSGKSACSVSSASKVIDYTFFYLYIN